MYVRKTGWIAQGHSALVRVAQQPDYSAIFKK
jgi:hypothetical protein